MSSGPQNFVLRSSLTSPFGRKVRMAVEVLGLSDRVMLMPADPLDDNDTLRQQNPLGKMPCLVRADGTAIYDSGVIIEFLADVAGTDRLLPARGAGTLQGAHARAARRRHHRRLDSDGLRQPLPPRRAAVGTLARASARQDHARARRLRGLAARSGKDRYRLHRLICALGYLDWRKQVEWRARSSAV